MYRSCGGHHTPVPASAPGAVIGRSPPVVTRASVGQVECKRLISTNAIDRSVTMQMVKSMQLRRLTLKTDE